MDLERMKMSLNIKFQSSRTAWKKFKFSFKE